MPKPKPDAPATRKDIDDVLGVMQTFMKQVDDRFNSVDDRFNAVEHDIAEIKEEIVDLKASHNRLLNTIDGFISRIDQYETEQAARDAQFERLLAWARKVSKKTGIPLEDL